MVDAGGERKDQTKLGIGDWGGGKRKRARARVVFWRAIYLVAFPSTWVAPGKIKIYEIPRISADRRRGRIRPVRLTVVDLVAWWKRWLLSPCSVSSLKLAVLREQPIVESV